LAQVRPTILKAQSAGCKKSPRLNVTLRIRAQKRAAPWRGPFLRKIPLRWSYRLMGPAYTVNQISLCIKPHGARLMHQAEA